MKLTRAEDDALNQVRGHGPDGVLINDRLHRDGVVVTRSRLIEPWSVGEAHTLGMPDFDWLELLAPEVVLLGTGARLVFPRAEVLRGFAARGIGLEVMDTAAACRGYAVLSSEGRAVAAALLPMRPAPGR